MCSTELRTGANDAPVFSLDRFVSHSYHEIISGNN